MILLSTFSFDIGAAAKTAAATLAASLFPRLPVHELCYEADRVRTHQCRTWPSLKLIIRRWQCWQTCAEQSTEQSWCRCR